MTGYEKVRHWLGLIDATPIEIFKQENALKLKEVSVMMLNDEEYMDAFFAIFVWLMMCDNQLWAYTTEKIKVGRAALALARLLGDDNGHNPST